MPKEKTLFVQGDSSEDDDVSLVKPRKMAASAPKAPKGHLSESEGDNIPLTQRYPKSKAKTSVPAKQKRKASPPAEPVAQKRSKKDRTSDSNTARKKKAAAEISRRCFRHPCSPKDHKTKRFDSAVASLLLDSVSHPLFASHVSQALDTCRIGKTESEKLHEVLDAVRVQATEYQCSDEATNTAIANVRRTWMKQQAATIATEVTDSTDLLTLFQGLIARVDGTGASELKDPKRTHGLCKRVTKAFDRPASKRSSTNTQDAGEAGATQDAEVNIIEPETTTPRCETAIPDTTVTTVEAPVTSEPPSIANEVKRATMCLMACQSSQSFWSLNTRAMIERLIELFHTPQDLFVAYVMRHMQELAVAAGLEVNNVANYQEAVDRWEGLNEPRQNTWKVRTERLWMGELRMFDA